MASKDYYTYGLRAAMNTAIAAPLAGVSGVVTYVVAQQAFILYESFIAETSTEAGVQALQQKLDSMVAKSDLTECQKQYPNYATEQTDAYVACLKRESLDLSVAPAAIMAVITGAYAYKFLLKAAAYARLGLNDFKGKLTRHFSSPKVAANVSPDGTMPVEEPAENQQEKENRFTIKNGVAPVASIVLKQDEEVYTEAGSLIAKGEYIEMSTMMQASPGRLISGESLSLGRFINKSTKDQSLILTPSTNGEIVEVKMPKGGRLICENGSFLASTKPVKVSAVMTGDLSMRVFSGLGRVLQSIKVDEPTNVLLSSSGQLTKFDLEENEAMHIQGTTLFGMSDSVSMQLEPIRSLFSRMAGGEGAFLLKLNGPGTVWLTSRGSGGRPGVIARTADTLSDIMRPGS